MRMPYRPGLDGVRAVAIVIVLLDHAGFGPFPNSGNVGVTLFFVVSGGPSCEWHPEWASRDRSCR